MDLNANDLLTALRKCGADLAVSEAMVNGLLRKLHEAAAEIERLKATNGVPERDKAAAGQ